MTNIALLSRKANSSVNDPFQPVQRSRQTRMCVDAIYPEAAKRQLPDLSRHSKDERERDRSCGLRS